MKKYAAEFIGTFVLALTVGVTLAGKFPVPTPVMAGLVLGVFVYTIGGISGAHINPAITLGLLSVRKISVKDAALYLVAQFFGGGFAMATSRAMLERPPLTVTDSVAVGASEALGAFLLAFGVAAVVYGKAPAAASGLTIGGSLLVGISVAAGSNGVLNPAVALGIGSFSLTYAVAPIVGAVIAMQLYKSLQDGA